MSVPVHRELRLHSPPLHGPDVRRLQEQINVRLRARLQATIAIDGEFGPQTARAAAYTLYLLGVPMERASVKRGGRLTQKQQRRIRRPETRHPLAVARGKRRSNAAIKKAKARPLREKALDVAESLLGVMEHGGNNQGPMVMKIIRANGGSGPEPWCGDFVAYCYRQAGSRRVQRAWASVAFLGTVSGLRTTRNPRAGDIVRFNFSHTGLFVRDLGGGMIETIEGNTGASGAVSDSATGGDGVYRKRRAKSLVTNYRHVLG